MVAAAPGHVGEASAAPAPQAAPAAAARGTRANGAAAGQPEGAKGPEASASAAPAAAAPAASPRAGHGQAKVAAPAASPAAAATGAASGRRGRHERAVDAAPAPVPYDLTYGVYISGRKVGFMHATLTLAPAPTLSTELTARIAGMGQTTEITIAESRIYGGQGGLLSQVDFVQAAATGKVHVHGERVGSVMRLEVAAGGVSHTVELPCRERLADAMATEAMARSGRLGARRSGVHLDPSVQREVAVVHTAVKSERRLLAGVEARALQIKSVYPDLGIEELSWVDPTGKALETQIGGMFVARLEPPEVARTLDTATDLLVAAVVRPPQPLAAPTSRRRIVLRMRGFGDQPPPTSPRQQVRQEGDVTELTLTRDAVPPHVPLPMPMPASLAAAAAPAAAAPGAAPTPTSAATPATAAPRQAGAPAGPTPVPAPAPAAAAPTSTAVTAPPPDDAAAVRAALLPTPFVQSDAPAIVAAARRALAGRTPAAAPLDVATASARLCAFVHHHIHAEYVPAYSNALEALESARGDCTEHSVLYVALARAAGIPARVAVGLAYWPPGNGFGWHAWAEIHVGDRWIAVDPTWNQPIADATHIKLADGGPAEQARIVMLLGNLQIESITAE